LESKSESEPAWKKVRTSESEACERCLSSEIARDQKMKNKIRADNSFPSDTNAAEKSGANSQDLWILHVNVDGFKTNAVHVEAHLALMERPPDIILLNETKLDEGSNDSTVAITGYVLISRRDRVSEHKGGGIAVFALRKKASHVTEVSKCEKHARCWVIVHTDDGPFLVGCWYRPPKKGNLEDIEDCAQKSPNHAKKQSK